MHRHRIRAFVTGRGETDVPVAIFAAGQFLRYVSPAVGVITSSLGPGTTTINALATWGDTTGTQLLNTSVLLDSSGNMTNLVTLDAQDAPNITAKTGTDPAVGEITVWASASAPWKLGRRVVAVNPTGDMTNVNTLNGRAPGILVGRSPTSAPTTNSVMVSADTTGIVASGTPVLIDSSGNMTGVGNINGSAPGNWVRGPASSVTDRIATYNGTTGKLIQDASGITASGRALGSVDFINGNAVFSGPASSTTNGIPRFTAANIVADSTATVDASGNVVVTTLNAVNPSTWVVGPASATSGGLAVYSGTTGKLIASGVTITASGGDLSNVSTLNGTTVPTGLWVQGPASSTDKRVARFNSTTGKLIQESAVTLDDSGNFTGAGTYNTVNVAAHASRHAPGGADTIFSGTYGYGDVVFHNGTSLVPHLYWVNTFTAASGTIGQYVTATSFRGGFHKMTAVVPLTLGDTSPFTVTPSWTGGTGVCCIQINELSSWLANGATGTFSTITASRAVLRIDMTVNFASAGNPVWGFTISGSTVSSEQWGYVEIFQL